MLSPEQLDTLFRPLFDEITSRIQSASNGSPELLFALRRKLCKELSYLERGKPMQRRALKARVFAAQDGKCAKCDCALEPAGKNAVLDRTEAIRGYVQENVRLHCHSCDRDIQAARNFA